MEHAHIHTQGELQNLLSQHPPTASTLQTIQHMLSHQSLSFNADLAHWLVVIVTDLPLIRDDTLGVGIEIVLSLTSQLLMCLSKGLCSL